jgi:hypothetical protein
MAIQHNAGFTMPMDQRSYYPQFSGVSSRKVILKPIIATAEISSLSETRESWRSPSPERVEKEITKVNLSHLKKFAPWADSSLLPVFKVIEIKISRELLLSHHTLDKSV